MRLCLRPNPFRLKAAKPANIIMGAFDDDDMDTQPADLSPLQEVDQMVDRLIEISFYTHVDKDLILEAIRGITRAIDTLRQHVDADEQPESDH